MTYKDALSASMASFISDPLARLVGYGLLGGKGCNGTAKMVPDAQIAEVTVAENLLIGMAHGMALTGLLPMAYVERADFLHCCMSAIANHLDVAKLISRGQFNPCVIIRVTVGGKKRPLFTGHTHTQAPILAMRSLLKMPVYELHTANEVHSGYERAIHEQKEGIGSSMLIDFRDDY